MESSSQTTMHASSQKRTLVIMAKAPKPGRVKTRLSKTLPPPAVTALYRCLLEDTVALAKSLTSVEVAVMCPESDKEELAALLCNTVQIVAQKGEGLAAGLTSVFRHFTAAGRQHVVAFNSDSPHLAPTVLDSAFEILATHDVVVGPTHDGGYYLVGPTTTSCVASISKALSRTVGARCGLSLLNATTCCRPAAVKCRKTEVSPAARPSPFCATI